MPKEAKTRCDAFSFTTRGLLRSATRKKRSAHAGVERRDCPSDLRSMLLRARVLSDSLPIRVAGPVRNTHDPGTRGSGKGS